MTLLFASGGGGAMTLLLLVEGRGYDSTFC